MVVAWFATAVILTSLQLWGLQTGSWSSTSLLLAVLLSGPAVGPLVAAVGRGFLGLVVLVHLAVILDPKIWGRAYFMASNIFSYLTMLALMIGALTRGARTRRSAGEA
jgi:hypothetical protein